MNILTNPLPTVTSACSNPVTAREKVISTRNAPLWGCVGPLMVTAGRVWSLVTVTVNAAVTAAFTPSSAEIVAV